MASVSIPLGFDRSYTDCRIGMISSSLMRGTQGYNYKNILKDKADVADEIKYELNIKLRMKFMFFCIYETFV